MQFWDTDVTGLEECHPPLLLPGLGHWQEVPLAVYGFSELENYSEVQYCDDNLHINISLQINCIRKTLILLSIK